MLSCFLCIDFNSLQLRYHGRSVHTRFQDFEAVLQFAYGYGMEKGRQLSFRNDWNYWNGSEWPRLPCHTTRLHHPTLLPPPLSLDSRIEIQAACASVDKAYWALPTCLKCFFSEQGKVKACSQVLRFDVLWCLCALSYHTEGLQGLEPVPLLLGRGVSSALTVTKECSGCPDSHLTLLKQ